MTDKILIDNGIVLTMNHRREIIRNGSVLVEGNRIVEVGEADTLKKKHAPDTVIDARDKVVMPG
ncbi:MAG: hypothetical protein QXG10_01250, partial [Candidatus Hadarchaeales archaeon]